MRTPLLLSTLLAVSAVACKKSETAEPKPAPVAAPAEKAVEKKEAPVAVEAKAEASKCPEGMLALPGGSYGENVVKPFCLDITEVTIADYRACTNKGACTDPDDAYSGEPCSWDDIDPPGRDNGRYAMGCVMPQQADAYCASIGKRLPTEVEFNWALRNGPAGTRFPWGNEDWTEDVPHQCRDGKDLKVPGAAQSNCPVGSCARTDSQLGFKDLAGGATEWVARGPNEDPAWRTHCGGASRCGPEAFTLTNYDDYEAGNCRPFSLQDGDVLDVSGFRCARDLPN